MGITIRIINVRRRRFEMDGYEQGIHSYRFGMRSDANPYRRGTRNYDQWREGWTDAALWDVASNCAETDPKPSESPSNKDN